jgi:hypothetical protein
MNFATSRTEKILILVKTYPALSRKYDELVCTAGITESGEWIRLYPIPFRKLRDDRQYPKYQWIELEIEKNTGDPRLESHRPVHMCEDIVFGEKVGTEDGWAARKELVLRNVYSNMTALIDCNKKDQGVSIAVFKPAKLLKFEIEEVEREWDPKKLKAIQARNAQMNLFGGDENPFQVVDKLPYKFSYVFEDEEGRQSTMMIEDWELGALYRNCLRQAGGDEQVACEKVKEVHTTSYPKSYDP